MKTFFPKAILTLLLAAAAVPCLAQQDGTVSFSYDANGNRAARTVSFAKDRGGSGLQGEPTCGLSASLLASATDELAGLRLSLYPNPTDGQFSVGVGNAAGGTRLEAVLYAPTGAVVSRKTLSGESIGFDLSGHAAGVYVLRIEVAGQTRIWKVIKH